MWSRHGCGRYHCGVHLGKCSRAQREAGKEGAASKASRYLATGGLGGGGERGIGSAQQADAGRQSPGLGEKLWKDVCQTRRHTFAWLRNATFSSVTLLKEEDGTYTQNLEGIDAMVRQAWEPNM